MDLAERVSYHRAGGVRQAAAELQIECLPLPAYSPDFIPVEALWRWLREDVTDQHCHASLDQLEAGVADFQGCINEDAIAPPDRLALKRHLDSNVEKLQISNQTRFSSSNIDVARLYADSAATLSPKPKYNS